LCKVLYHVRTKDFPITKPRPCSGASDASVHDKQPVGGFLWSNGNMGREQFAKPMRRRLKTRRRGWRRPTNFAPTHPNPPRWLLRCRLYLALYHRRWRSIPSAWPPMYRDGTWAVRREATQPRFRRGTCRIIFVSNIHYHVEPRHRLHFF